MVQNLNGNLMVTLIVALIARSMEKGFSVKIGVQGRVFEV